MECIDFDARFAEYTTNWMKEHTGEYADMEAMEADMPNVYLRFLNTPAPWLDGAAPGAFFARYDDSAQLVDWLTEYCHRRVPLPDPLLDRILELGTHCQDDLMALVKKESAPREARMTAIGLLREMESAAPMELYIAWQKNRRDKDELCENALESLAEMGRQAVPALLDALPQCNKAGQEALLDILCRYPGHEQVFQTALSFFEKEKNNRALFAGYLGKLGDERALPVLLKAAGEELVSYLDFIEIRNAIEMLGGDAPAREFSEDPGYEAMQLLQ